MKHSKNANHRNVKSRNMLYLVLLLFGVFIGVTYSLSTSLYDTRSRAATQLEAKSLKLGTFDAPTPIPTATRAPTPTKRPAAAAAATAPPPAPLEHGTIITPAIGGPKPPANYYCIDDEDPDMCDDNSSHLVPKGSAGVSGTCGTVIEQTHKLVDALPQYMKGKRDSLTKQVTSSCGTAAAVSAPDYVSTRLVIDAYNLAGFSEVTSSLTSPSAMFTWWQSPPAGYEYILYTPDAVKQYAEGIKDLTGCVMFLNTGSGYHIGIVNFLELYTTGGDGVISILQSGTSMYIDRFPVSGWAISGNSTNMTNTNGVIGFGCHT